MACRGPGFESGLGHLEKILEISRNLGNVPKNARSVPRLARFVPFMVRFVPFMVSNAPASVLTCSLLGLYSMFCVAFPLCGLRLSQVSWSLPPFAGLEVGCSGSRGMCDLLARIVLVTM